MYSRALALVLLAACAEDSADPAVPELLAPLDAAAGELPEGIAIHGDTTYVGLIGLGRVDKLDRAGTRTPFGTLPPGPRGQTFVVGLTADRGGDVYAIYGSFADAAATGVYRIPRTGGPGVRFAGHPELRFPNDLDFAPDGSLFVTDSSGAIFRFADGAGAAWSRDPLLAPGGSLPCGAHGGEIPLGANGISHDGTSVVVTNTEHAMVVRIPVLADGSAGPGEIIAGPDCERLAGVDGLVAESADSWLLAVQRNHSVTRLHADGRLEIVAAGGVLDGPASLDLDDSRRRLVVTSSAFGSVDDPAATPRPGVVEIALD